MSEYRRIETETPRGLRTRSAVLLATIAFVLGSALAVYAARRFGWPAPPAAATRPAANTGPQQAVPPAPAVQVDPAALAGRQEVLAAQVATLEARIAAVTTDTQAAGAQARRAEALLVAFATRRAIDRGLPLGYLEAQLHARFGTAEPKAVAYLVQASRAPLTLGDLREGLATIGPGIASGAGAGWLAGARRELGNLVVLRRGGTPSPIPEDRLARARRLLEGGQVEAARAEVARLPGAAQATNWMEAARRYVIARHALDRLEGAALRTPTEPSPSFAAAPAYP